MIELTSGAYTIQIRDEPAYDLNSMDNATHYEKILWHDDLHYQASSKHSVQIWLEEEMIHACLVLGCRGKTAVTRQSVLLHHSDLYLCCGDSLICLSVDNLRLKWRLKADEATSFGVYQADGGLIVHGELSIARINLNGNIVWTFSGADIFVCLNDPRTITITEDRIDLIDFSGNRYILDHTGNLLSQS